MFVSIEVASKACKALVWESTTQLELQADTPSSYLASLRKKYLANVRRFEAFRTDETFDAINAIVAQLAGKGSQLAEIYIRDMAGVMAAVSFGLFAMSSCPLLSILTSGKFSSLQYVTTFIQLLRFAYSNQCVVRELRLCTWSSRSFYLGLLSSEYLSPQSSTEPPKHLLDIFRTLQNLRLLFIFTGAMVAPPVVVNAIVATLTNLTHLGLTLAPTGATTLPKALLDCS